MGCVTEATFYNCICWVVMAVREKWSRQRKELPRGQLSCAVGAFQVAFCDFQNSSKTAVKVTFAVPLDKVCVAR